jgi:hypothetical protein
MTSRVSVIQIAELALKLCELEDTQYSDDNFKAKFAVKTGWIIETIGRRCLLYRDTLGVPISDCGRLGLSDPVIRVCACRPGT